MSGLMENSKPVSPQDEFHSAAQADFKLFRDEWNNIDNGTHNPPLTDAQKNEQLTELIKANPIAVATMFQDANSPTLTPEWGFAHNVVQEAYRLGGAEALEQLTNSADYGMGVSEIASRNYVAAKASDPSATLDYAATINTAETQYTANPVPYNSSEAILNYLGDTSYIREQLASQDPKIFEGIVDFQQGDAVPPPNFVPGTQKEATTGVSHS